MEGSIKGAFVCSVDLLQERKFGQVQLLETPRQQVTTCQRLDSNAVNGAAAATAAAVAVAVAADCGIAELGCAVDIQVTEYLHRD